MYNVILSNNGENYLILVHACGWPKPTCLCTHMKTKLCRGIFRGWANKKISFYILINFKRKRIQGRNKL